MPASPTDGICNLTQEDGSGLFLLEDGSGALILEVCDEVATPSGVGQIGRRHSYTEEDFQKQRPFTRQYWEELKRAWRAQQALEEKARKFARGKSERDRKRAQGLAEAARAAEQALELAQLHENNRLASLARTLERAAGVSATVQQIHAAQLRSIAFEAHLAEMEDEEEALILLM